MKRLFVLLAVVLFFCVCAVLANAENTKAPRLVDKGEMLSENEEAELLAKLDSISERYDYDVVVHTEASLYGVNAQRAAAEAYIRGHYGMGEDKESGVILLVSLTDREWYIEFFGERRVTEGTALSQYFIDQLSYGDYYGAFNSFADAVGDELAFPFGTILAVSLIIGLIVALIVTSVMKSKLKSVAMQKNAREYIREGSFNLRKSRDLYLYSTVTRVARPKNTSSGSRGGLGGSRGGFGGSRGGGGRF